MTSPLIDYATPHGRAHTRAADLAFLLRPADATLHDIATEPNPTIRARKLRALLRIPGSDYDLVRLDDGTVAVVVQPEPGQTHPPVTAVVTDRSPRSVCTCPRTEANR